MADLTTQLSKFLNDLMAGKLGVANAITSIVVGDGTAAAPSYAFQLEPGTGFARVVSGSIDVMASGGSRFRIGPNPVLPSSGAIGWDSGGQSYLTGASVDTTIGRDGAPGVFALKSGTVAQTFRVYVPDIRTTHSTTGLWIYNNSAATAGIPVQMSSPLFFRGNAWNTVGLASETDDFFVENLPAAGNPSTATLKVGFSNNGGAATYPFTVDSTGQVTALGNIQTALGNIRTTGNVQVGGTLGTPWVWIFPIGQNQTRLSDGPNTAGVGLDWSVDNVFAIRNRALNADAGITASTAAFSGAVTKVNGVTTTGFGVPPITASYETTGNTGAVTNAVNYTPAAAASTYKLEGVVNVTAWTTPASFTVTAGYTDASGTARTDTAMVIRGSNGATAAAVTAIDRWYFVFPAIDINNAGVAITLSTAGTFTGSPVYNLQGTLSRVR